MPKILLTDRNVRSLAPKGDEKRAEFWDRSLPSFGIRVTSAGVRSFFILYWTRDGRRRRLTLGGYPVLSLAEARELAREKLRLISQGVDPQEPVPEDPRPTFADLAAEYMERHARVKKRSWRDDQRRLELDLLPQWGQRPACEITRRDVIAVLDRVADRGAPISANRLRALVSGIFNFGIARELVEHNPAFRTPRPGVERASDRVLDDGEIRRLWETLDRSENLLMAGILKLRLLLGQRTREVVSMRWDEINGEVWRLPGGASKNRRGHSVPLGPLALEVLEGLRPIAGDQEWVFASPRKAGAPVIEIKRFLAQVVAESGVRFVTRDLRRTVSTGMIGIGISQLTVAKLLNHTIQNVTDRHYDRYSYDPEKRHAVLAWDAHLQQVFRGDAAASNLVTFVPRGEP
jgi:integrase